MCGLPLYPVVRHSAKVEWTKHDGEIVRAFVNTDTGRKVMLAVDDAAFNAAFTRGPDYVRGMIAVRDYILSLRSPEEEADDSSNARTTLQE